MDLMQEELKNPDLVNDAVSYGLSIGKQGFQRNIEIAYVHSDYNSLRFSREGDDFALSINNRGMSVTINGSKTMISIKGDMDLPVYVAKKMFADKTLEHHLNGVNYAISTKDDFSARTYSQNRILLLSLRAEDPSLAHTIPPFSTDAIEKAVLEMWKEAYSKYRAENPDAVTNEEVERFLAMSKLFTPAFLKQKIRSSEGSSDTEGWR